MTRFVVPALLVLLTAVTGCLPVFQSDTCVNEPPVAYIDSVSATKISQGQTLSLAGHGTDVGGTIVAYSWRSDIDGVLSTLPSFSTSSLSTGTHTIFFKVQDNSGDWSKEKYFKLNVVAPGTIKPTVNNFEANPSLILEGQGATLIWNVSNATTISIAPSIGDVPAQGSRLVTPNINTSYVLTASNEAGVVTDEVRVSVITKSANTVELFSIPGEEGSVDQNGQVTGSPRVGVASSSTSVQAFFSFDISGIPSGATITSAALDLTTYIMYGQPFSYLGALGAFNDQYGTLDSNDYVSGFAFDGLFFTYSDIIRPYDTQQIITALQKQVDQHNTRFQVRAQFEKFVYFQMAQVNYLDFINGKAKLTVTFE